MIRVNDERLQYMGRVDFIRPDAALFTYPNTQVKLKFNGTGIKVLLQNHSTYYQNEIGCLVDGEQYRFVLPDEKEETWITLAEDLDEGEHTLILFKRMDGCHEILLLGFELDGDGGLMMPDPLPKRKLEFYGDSVTCGEVSEALDYVGMADPEHNGEYSNAYYSYAAYTARMLEAQFHIVAQGGVPLLDGTGWFHAPDYIGMESIYDKTRYNPDFGELRSWDFKNYTPHVAVVALGQNDANPDDYMKVVYGTEEPSPAAVEKANRWKREYQKFIMRLRDIYPEAVIILTTTILEHHFGWDAAIGEVHRELKDPKIKHFLYSRNGCGTKGHARKPEAKQMARELSEFIRSMGDEIWH